MARKRWIAWLLGGLLAGCGPDPGGGPVPSPTPSYYPPPGGAGTLPGPTPGPS